jgi:drug/metabolite transporter (DMT)-like permease
VPGGSILGYLLWFHLLKVCGVTAASAYYFLMPPLGMLFGWMVLGEHVAFRDLLGIVPVAFGIYLVTRPAKMPGRHQGSVDVFASYYADRKKSGVATEIKPLA